MLATLGFLAIAAAQQVGRPAATHPQGFTSLTAVRELPDGRVLVLEACEEGIHLLDFRTGLSARVGRPGAGPGEYRGAVGLWPLPGDSTLTHDHRNARFLVIDPRGIPGRFQAAPPVVNVHAGRYGIGVPFTAGGADARGLLYSRQHGIRVTHKGHVREDSVPVERWDPWTGGRDTAAFSRSLNPGPYRSTPDAPFAASVPYAVASDGRVATVYPNPYHVEFTDSTGRRTTGGPVPWMPVRVTNAHKEQWRKDWDTGCAVGTRVVDVGESRPVVLRQQPPPEPREWPAYLPPFLRGAAQFAPDGTLWVRRTTPASSPALYDLIDRAGNRIRQVTLPDSARLLGFGKGVLYLARMDADGLQYVERYNRPEPHQRMTP